LKIAPFTLSVVGRVLLPVNVFNFLPPNSPATTRMSACPSLNASSFANDKRSLLAKKEIYIVIIKEKDEKCLNKSDIFHLN
jgi:hypothetical protein